jgi:predicted aminopeptidase
VRLRSLFGILLAALVAGCTPTEYYWQGMVGQIDLLQRAQPIDRVLAQSDDEVLRRKLALAREIRAFASDDLGLPRNASYTRYVDLGRPYVTWNVFAAPALSLEARQWCFPVAGCVNYRGYFDERDARAEADALRAIGNDVHVSGVPAYSTLGWFDDPVLSSFVRYPDTELARMIFHELAHQVLYVRDDTVFNESFAAAVEEEGVRRWIAAQPQERRGKLEAEFARNDVLRKRFRELVVVARDRLRAIYASDATDVEKLAQKARAFAEMRAGYERAKAGEAGLAGYERWFAGEENRGPNNASLAAVSLYTERVPAFRALLVQSGNDLPTFYGRVRDLAALPRAQRDAAMAVLSGERAAAADSH